MQRSTQEDAAGAGGACPTLYPSCWQVYAYMAIAPDTCTLRERIRPAGASETRCQVPWMLVLEPTELSDGL